MTDLNIKEENHKPAQQRLQKKRNSKQGQKVPLRANNADVDQKETHQWFRSSGLQTETEEFILAAQDQTRSFCLLTRNYQPKVMKNGADPRCSICTQYE